MSQLTTNQILGALITYNREAAGVSIGKLAGGLDVSYQHVWDLENDHRTVTEQRLEEIIALLKTKPETFWLNTPRAIKKLKKKMAEKHLLN